MIDNKLMGVILAAGKGRRIYPFSEKWPKSLLPVGNKSLLEFQIHMMRKIGIRQVLVVIGHYGFEIVKSLGNGNSLGVSIEYVDQKEALGIAHALGQLEPHIDRSFVLFLGDIYFVTTDLNPMLEAFSQEDVHAVLATKVEENPEAIKRNFAVIENQDGRVTRVIEKPRYTINNLKGCGLYVFDLHIFDAIRRTPRTALRDEYEITEAIQVLINDGFGVRTANVIAEDINITFPHDLLRANLVELKRQGKECLVGKDVSVPNLNRVHHSVIGDRVTVKRDIGISHSVIFAQTLVGVESNLERTIVTPERIIYCPE